ncbi:MAG: hypothetical protein IPJ38_05150 [Dechloromonas sp.]|uniref:Tail specific protease domain-containing protein n=1 Tax=Candidatus Dechloromonas phosphorivorans TaxID=2899244 RepID=A0A935JWV2_9RHOO|nr:hypothetical protein [Candidatus Dechloromonas phosphorivorans]
MLGGPLGVLVINRGSASALLEIFAATMQDYGRGVLIGEEKFLVKVLSKP